VEVGDEEGVVRADGLERVDVGAVESRGDRGGPDVCANVDEQPAAVRVAEGVERPVVNVGVPGAVVPDAGADELVGWDDVAGRADRHDGGGDLGQHLP
jgi:hypothetical protein